MQQVWPFPLLGGLFYHSWVLLNTAVWHAQTKVPWVAGSQRLERVPGMSQNRVPASFAPEGPRPGWWAQGNYTEGMFRWLSLPFLLYPYFRWKALFGHGGAGFRLFVVCLRGLSPFSTRLQLVECGDSSLPLDLFMQTNLRGQTGFSDIFNFGFNNSFEQGKKPRIYFRRCVKCFFSHTNTLVWDVSCVQNNCLLPSCVQNNLPAACLDI